MESDNLLKDPEYVITAEGFHSAYLDVLRSEIKTWPARSWTPSNLGHPCDRFLVWRWTRWNEGLKHDPIKQAIFREGNIHAPDVYQRLEKMGFGIQREGEKTTQWEPKKGVIISGRIDGKILSFRDVKYDPSIILEIKTTSPYTFDALNTIQDVREHRAFYVRGYYDQDQLYCVLENRPRGIMVFKNKQTGMLKAIPFEIDYDRGEWLIARAERLAPMVREKIDPPPIPFDDFICGDCTFKGLCYPPVVGGEGAKLIEDGELLEMLEERATVADKRARYEELDKAVKSKAKQALGKDGMGMCGPWEVSTKTSPRKAYEVKASEATTVTLRRIE